jgi:hypothetical protein
MITLFWHLWVLGHSIRVNRCITRSMGDSSKGWLYVCECGETFAR